jgi:hypothetical protein
MNGRQAKDHARWCCWIGVGVSCKCLNHPVDHAHMEVHMGVQAGLEAVDEGDITDTHGCLVKLRRTGAMPVHALLNNPQKNVQRRVRCRPIALHEVAQPLGHRRHPLAHRKVGRAWSTRCAAICAMRHASHERQTPRLLQVKATKQSVPQASHQARAKPWAKMQHSRQLRNACST